MPSHSRFLPPPDPSDPADFHRVPPVAALFEDWLWGLGYRPGRGMPCYLLVAPFLQENPSREDFEDDLLMHAAFIDGKHLLRNLEARAA